MNEEILTEVNKVLAPHRVEAFKEVHSSIECLHKDLSEALDLTSIQNQFDQHVFNLKQKEDQLRSTIKKLELTKETLVEEVHHRETEEQRITQLISDLKIKREELDRHLSGYEHDVQNLKSEKEKLDGLLGRMKSVLLEMRTKVQEFSTIVKAE